MGLIGQLAAGLFGGGNVIRETAEVFRENAEAGAQRDHEKQAAALAQFAAEFTGRRGWFDALIDGLNRLPRPLLALGTIGLMIAAMVDPLWFSERMMGLSLVPEALWWLMGAVVSFYFGARHQAKGQQFQREIAATMTRAPEVTAALEARRGQAVDAVQRPASEGGGAAPGTRSEPAPTPDSAIDPDANPALEEWLQLRRR